MNRLAPLPSLDTSRPVSTCYQPGASTEERRRNKARMRRCAGSRFGAVASTAGEQVELAYRLIAKRELAEVDKPRALGWARVWVWATHGMMVASEDGEQWTLAFGAYRGALVVLDAFELLLVAPRGEA